MKRINILFLIMLLVVFTTGCSHSKVNGVQEGKKINKEDLKIGFVH